MSLYRKLSRKPKRFLAVTGMNLYQFQALLPQFAHAYDKFERRWIRLGPPAYATRAPFPR